MGYLKHLTNLSLKTLSIVFLISCVACKKVDVPDGTPQCIKKKIRKLLSDAPSEPSYKVWKYEYKGETVYYFPPKCCDIQSQLFDEDCNQICSPDGGLTGGGDGKCKDFFSTRSKEVLVWEDDR